MGERAAGVHWRPVSGEKGLLESPGGQLQGKGGCSRGPLEASLGGSGLQGSPGGQPWGERAAISTVVILGEPPKKDLPGHTHD